MSKRKTSTAAHHRKQPYHVSRGAQSTTHKRKTTNVVLVMVLLLPLIGAGIYLLIAGPQVAGLVMLVAVAAVLLWLWKL